MNDLIKSNLPKIQAVVKDSLVDIISGLRVSEAGNLQIFLKEQSDSSSQEDFKEAVETLDPELTVTYQENLDQYGEPETYNNKGKKTQLSPAFVIHLVKEPKSLDSMFDDLMD